MVPPWVRRYSAIKHVRIRRCSRDKRREAMMSLSAKAQRGIAEVTERSSNRRLALPRVAVGGIWRVLLGKQGVIMSPERSIESGLWDLTGAGSQSKGMA